MWIVESKNLSTYLQYKLQANQHEEIPTTIFSLHNNLHNVEWKTRGAAPLSPRF